MIAPLSTGTTSPVLAREPIVLEAATPWNVDWSSTTCTLRRGFGNKDKPDILWFERFGPTNQFRLTFIGGEFKNFQDQSPLEITFGEQKPQRVPAVSVGQTQDGTATLFIGTFVMDPVARANKNNSHEQDFEHPNPVLEASVTSLTLRSGGQVVVVKTGQLDKPFAAMRACTADLVKSWGLDPLAQAELAALPKPISSPANWIHSEDYPSQMTGAGKQALVSFRLTVDPQGKPVACEIQRSFSDPLFDKVTCQILMRRAKLEPARDKTGKSVASYYLNTVRWILN